MSIDVRRVLEGVARAMESDVAELSLRPWMGPPMLLDVDTEEDDPHAPPSDGEWVHAVGGLVRAAPRRAGVTLRQGV